MGWDTNGEHMSKGDRKDTLRTCKAYTTREMWRRKLGEGQDEYGFNLCDMMGSWVRCRVEGSTCTTWRVGRLSMGHGYSNQIDCV